MMIKRFAAVAALLLLGSAAAEAQRQPMMHGQATDTVPSMEMARGMMMGGMMGRGMMGSGMMGMMGQGMGMMTTGGPGPAALLRIRDALELTDEQVSTLESMRADLQGQMQGRMTAMMTAHQAAAAALDSETPDWDAYEGNLATAANIMVQTQVMMARAAQDAQEVLTPEQREALEARGTQMMRGTMRGMGPRGR
jgi:Spy/CpxP family protein refolding chaperone